MRKLVYFVAVSVDGCIAGPAGQIDFFSGEGDHLAAQVSELPETIPRHFREALGVSSGPMRFDTVVMGRATYEPALSAGITDPYAPLQTVVFSRRLASKQEGGLRITAEDPVGFVRTLKERDGRDIWLCGGGELAQTLLPELDELVVKVNPVLAGAGIRLSAGGFDPRELSLRESRVFDSGVIWLTYEVARP